MSDHTFKSLGSDVSVPAIIEYLNYVASLDFTQSYIRDSIEALELNAGDTLAELGCGNAHDALQLCTAVSPGGRVVFVDQDEAILKVAATHPETLKKASDVEFIRGDVLQLGIHDSSVDGARIVRTLQHVADPKRALSEMLRIVRPRKRIVAIEPDWSTFAIDPGESVSAILREQISAGILSPSVGGQVASYLRELGASEVDFASRTMDFNTLAKAEKVFLLEDKLKKAKDAGRISEATALSWMATVIDASRAGHFRCSIDFAFVTATK